MGSPAGFFPQWTIWVGMKGGVYFFFSISAIRVLIPA
jgi:hypothetical protein